MSVFFTRRGEAPPDGTFIINFYDAVTQYKFKSGMTWREWINSEYNTDGYYVSDNFVRHVSNMGAVVWAPVGTTYQYARPSDLIVDGTTYHARASNPTAP